MEEYADFFNPSVVVEEEPFPKHSRIGLGP